MHANTPFKRILKRRTGGSWQLMAWLVCAASLPSRAGAQTDFSPPPDERQLPTKMHSAMQEQPVIKVGQSAGDLVGRDHRVLQAAMDYLAGLGGGTLEIGAGEFLMRDSLHLRSRVTVRGTPGQTILRKADGVACKLAIDGDYGEEQVTLANPHGFDVGCGLAIWNSRANNFHGTVARIIGRTGNRIALSLPLNSDYLITEGSQAATVYPVVSGCNVEGVRIEHLIIEGNGQNNVSLNGCRGGGIYLYRGFGAVIDHCTVRNFNGDGISFQQSNDVTVQECLCENNSALGLHPGSGSQRPKVLNCIARNNGTDGLFLCWRVRHGLFTGNVLENNGQYGISIGHKDSDNLLNKNIVRGNHSDGVFFRNETLGMAAHRNRLEDNLIENNGLGKEVAGIRIHGETREVVLKNNRIQDTRPPGSRKQTIGIQLEEQAGPVVMEQNEIDAAVPLKDRRRSPDPKPPGN
jgi:parallel beta-helix repeat protein